MGKVEANKFKKLNTILDSAFDLFTNQGVENTSIADIAKHAGVAKGTFYLYFQDKHELRNRLIYHKSSKLFKEAADENASKKSSNRNFPVSGSISSSQLNIIKAVIKTYVRAKESTVQRSFICLRTTDNTIPRGS